MDMGKEVLMLNRIDKISVTSITQKIAEIDAQLDLLYLVRFKNTQTNEEDDAYDPEGDVYIDEKGNEKTVNDGRSRHHNLFINLVNKRKQLEEILHHNLFKELVNKRKQLELPKNQKEIESTLPEKIHRGLVWGSIVTISGFIVGIFRDLAKIFSAAIGAIIELGSNIASFTIQGILSLWDLALIAADKITGKNTIERSRSKILTAIIVVGLTIFALLLLAKVIVIAGVVSPFIIPGIFMSISALNLSHENRKYEDIEKKIVQNKERIMELEDRLKNVIKKLMSENKEIKDLNKELAQLELARRDDPTNAELSNEKKAKKIQFIKRLYDFDDVYSAAKALHAARMEKEILAINKKYSQKKRKTLRKSVLSTVLIISGVGITFLLPPLGLVISGIGFALLGGNYNEHRNLREKEKTAIKKHDKKNEFDSIAVMDLIKDNSKNNSKIMQIPIIKNDYPHLETKYSAPEPTAQDTFIYGHEQTLKTGDKDRRSKEVTSPTEDKDLTQIGTNTVTVSPKF